MHYMIDKIGEGYWAFALCRIWRPSKGKFTYLHGSSPRFVPYGHPEGVFMPLTAPRRENTHPKRNQSIPVPWTSTGYDRQIQSHAILQSGVFVFACSLVPLVIYEEAKPRIRYSTNSISTVRT